MPSSAAVLVGASGSPARAPALRAPAGAGSATLAFALRLRVPRASPGALALPLVACGACVDGAGAELAPLADFEAALAEDRADWEASQPPPPEAFAASAASVSALENGGDPGGGRALLPLRAAAADFGASEAVPVAYSFRLWQQRGDARAEVRPRHWALEARRAAGAAWRVVDERRLADGGAGADWVALLAPADVGVAVALRIVLRDCAGAEGGHSRSLDGGVLTLEPRVWTQPPPSPPRFSMPAAAAAAAAAAAPALALAPVAALGWAVFLFGPPAQRRLRIASGCGSLDAVTAAPLPPAAFRRSGVPIRVRVWERDPAVGGSVSCDLFASVSLGGAPLPLISMECVRAQRFGVAATAIARARVPSAALRGGGRGGDPVAVGWCASLGIEIARTGSSAGSSARGRGWLALRARLACARMPLACFRGLALDAPPECRLTPAGAGPSETEAEIWDVVSIASADSAGEADPALRFAGGGGGGGGGGGSGGDSGGEDDDAGDDIDIGGAKEGGGADALSTDGPGAAIRQRSQRLAVPIRSFEEVLLWRPRSGADAAVDRLMRCAVPLRPRFSRGLDSGAAVADLGCARVPGLVSERGPLSLLCHDCGPAVYVEDSAARLVGAPLGAAPHISDVDAAPVPSPACAPGGPLSRCRVSPAPLASDADLPAAHSVAAAGVGMGASVAVGHGYRFERWPACDVFAYFSHARVSVPPPGWVAAAHANGARCLGTICTEWASGEAANDLMIAAYAATTEAGPAGGDARELEPTPTLARQLASIAAYHGFDGWLVNVEAALPFSADHLAEAAGPAAGVAAGAAVDALVAFVRELTVYVHALVGATPASAAGLSARRRSLGDPPLPPPSPPFPVGSTGLVVWYDSVDARRGAHCGRVCWQSELGEANAPFLAACDALFLDYHWGDGPGGKLRATARRARELAPAQTPGSRGVACGPRSRDVFVGIDLWGRGGFGGGGFAGARIAARAIRDAAEAAHAEVVSEAAPSEAVAEAAAEAVAETAPASAAPKMTVPEAPLSVALFGPAWAYEARGGAASLSRFRALEQRMWGLRGRVREAAVEGTAAARWSELPVLNPSGFVAGESARAALRQDAAAIAKLELTGWSVDSAPGQGWAVRACGNGGGAPSDGGGRDDGESGAESDGTGGLGVAAGAEATCFVTSHAWCWASQTLALPAAPGAPPSEPVARAITLSLRIRVSEWYRGTPPDVADRFRLRAVLLDAMGAELAAADSGELVCGANWRLAELELVLVEVAEAAGGAEAAGRAVSVRISHGGRDAEHWAGHFGAQMRGARVHAAWAWGQASEGAGVGEGAAGGGIVADKDEDTLLALLGGSRPVRGDFRVPFASSFSCGVGAARWADGVLLQPPQPWLSLGESEALPSFLGIDADAGVCGRVFSRLAHDAAWRGGTSLLVEFEGSAGGAGDTGNASAARVGAALVGVARLFSLDAPLPAGRGLCVSLVWRVVDAPADAQPDTISLEPELLARGPSGALAPLALVPAVSAPASASASRWRHGVWKAGQGGGGGVVVSELRVAAWAPCASAAPRAALRCVVRIGRVDISEA